MRNVRCTGTVAAFEIEAGETNYLNPIGKVIQRHCIEQGVYLRPLGNVVYLLPPLHKRCNCSSATARCSPASRSSSRGNSAPG